MFGGRFYRLGMVVCLISEMSLGVDVINVCVKQIYYHSNSQSLV